MIWSSRMTAKAMSGIYLIEVLMLAPLTSSFVSPTGGRLGGIERRIIRGSCSYNWRRLATTEPEAVKPVVEVEDDEGSGDEVRTPAGLTLEGVYKRLYVEVQGLDDGVVGLESKDTDYGVEVIKVKLEREPSLGLRLEEVARGGDGRGLVLVSGIEAGGNAEASGKITIGDTISWVGVEPDRMTRVEALDWDQTVNAIGSYVGEREITLVNKRLVKREMINVEFLMPDGTKAYEIYTGSNLRGEMIRLGVPVYDPNTLRYDQPYATGNCAGEGICGTCFVEVQEGKELLSPPDREEQALLVRGGLPARWRLSCKTIVGKDNVPGTVRVKAVPQTEWRERRTRK